MMKVPTIAVIPALLVLCVGMAIGQDAAHDVDKAATKTGHAVKHATKKVGNATKTGAKDIGHGAEVTANDAGKGVKTGTKKTGDGVKDAVTKWSKVRSLATQREQHGSRDSISIVDSKGEVRLTRS
jgi:hypothetical protein